MISKLRSIVISFFFIIFIGCTAQDDGLPPLPEDEDITLKVATFGSGYSDREYANFLENKYPKLKVDLISYSSLFAVEGKNFDEEFDKWIEEHEPDLIQFPQSSIFTRWAQENRLYELDPMIKATKFDIDGINSNIIEFIKKQGNGKLYGLAPQFDSYALLYNKDLFDEYGVDYPVDRMNWEEILNLAKRFPQFDHEGDKLYGFYLGHRSTAYDLIEQVGRVENLTVYDDQNQTFTIHTPEWKRIFELVLEGYREGFIFLSDFKARTQDYFLLNDLLENDLFLTSRAAMTIQSYMYLDYLNPTYIREAQIDLKGRPLPNWDIVTVPVYSHNRDSSNYFELWGIYAIRSNTSNLRAAWEYIAYANSDEMAKKWSKIPNIYLMSSRTEHNAMKDGRSLEPFYTLKPGDFVAPKWPNDFFAHFNNLVSDEIHNVLEDKLTLDEALIVIEQKAQEALAAW